MWLLYAVLTYSILIESVYDMSQIMMSFAVWANLISKFIYSDD